MFGGFRFFIFSQLVSTSGEVFHAWNEIRWAVFKEKSIFEIHLISISLTHKSTFSANPTQ